MILFENKDELDHFNHISGKGFKELIDGPVADDQTAAAPPPPRVKQDLRGSTKDDRFNDPVRMHGVEGERDASKPFSANRKWRLQMGADGRAEIVTGELEGPGRKLNWDSRLGVVLTDKSVPTVLPNNRPAGYR
jgi:hypothetical protein